jgi:PAS domain S-box-containing protein
VAAPSNRERFLEAVMASVTDYAIVAMDTIGLVTSWNEGARRVLGWTETEMIGTFRRQSARWPRRHC